MIEDNFSKDANKDFPSITNTHLQQETALCSEEVVSDKIQSSIKELDVEFMSFRLSLASRDLNIITRTFRCGKMIQFVGFVASCSGTLILIDLDGSAYRHQFLADPPQ
jgi:hypothetical protein